MKYYASLETGGTKCVCAIGNSPESIVAQEVFATTTADETISRIINFFRPHIAQYDITKMGITSFGPIDLHTQSPTYGYITSTPKEAWKNTNLLGRIKDALRVEVSFDTDVNGAALAEGKWGSAKGSDTYAYITVGTGVGVGVVANNSTLRGMLHPEGGHMILPLHPEDPSKGFCPYHGNCLEGLASGTAFNKRWNKPAQDIEDGHIGWDIEAYYLAIGIVNLVCTVSPQKIVLGGGLTKRASLLPLVRKKVQELLNNYINTKELISDIDHYIVPATLEHSGLLGGIIMAKNL